QAEDGIRDRNVTGVQTCALPISEKPLSLERKFMDNYLSPLKGWIVLDFILYALFTFCGALLPYFTKLLVEGAYQTSLLGYVLSRSEERRVGKECGYRRCIDQNKA